MNSAGHQAHPLQKAELRRPRLLLFSSRCDINEEESEQPLCGLHLQLGPAGPATVGMTVLPLLLQRFLRGVSPSGPTRDY